MRLSGPWGEPRIDVGVSNPPDNIWSLNATDALTGIRASSQKFRNGWVVTKVSGDWGKDDLVVDITIPEDLTGVRDYVAQVTFLHLRGVSNTHVVYHLANAFHIQYDEVDQPWGHVTEFVQAPTGEYYAANTDVDGLHIYSIDPGLDFYKERSVHEDLYCPAIAFDEAGIMYLLAAKRADSFQDYTIQLYRSSDRGKTFDNVSQFFSTDDIPVLVNPTSWADTYWDSYGRPISLGLSYLRHGVLVVFCPLYWNGGFSIPVASRDYGKTFDLKDVGAGARRILPLRDGNYFNGSAVWNAVDGAQILYSSFSWYDENNAPIGTGATLIPNPRTHQIIAIGNPRGDFRCSRAKTLTRLAAPAGAKPRYSIQGEPSSIIAFYDIQKHGSQGGSLILILDERSGRLVAGNGQIGDNADYHYSDDMGRTWLTKNPTNAS